MRDRLGVLEWGVAILLILLVLVVFSQVLLRYLTYQPLAWTEELARYLFIWLSLLGAAVAVRRGQHFAVDTLQSRFRGRACARFVLVLTLLEAAFYLTLAGAGAMLIPYVHSQRSPSFDLPMSLPYLAVPCGALIMAVAACRRAIDRYNADRR
jgi:TRAP-type transport system small permease protein